MESHRYQHVLKLVCKHAIKVINMGNLHNISAYYCHVCDLHEMHVCHYDRYEWRNPSKVVIGIWDCIVWLNWLLGVGSTYERALWPWLGL